MKHVLRFRRRVTLVGCIAVVGLVAAIVVASASAGSSSRASHSVAIANSTTKLARVRARRLAGKLSKVASAARAQAADFAVFSGADASTSSMPATLANLFEPYAGIGLNIGQAREVTLSSGSVWIVPGTSGICLALIPSGQPGPVGVSCATEAEAEAGHAFLYAGRIGAPGFVAGVVPDGITSVQLDQSGGRVTTAPVTDNVYAATLSLRLEGVKTGGTPESPVG